MEFLAVLLVTTQAFGRTFFTGLTSPTGIAVHPTERALYVNSRDGLGQLISIEILPTGVAGDASSIVPFGFPVDTQIVDGAGNIYGSETGTENIYRVDSNGVLEVTHLFFAELDSGIAIEPPGLSSSPTFASNAARFSEFLYRFRVDEFDPGNDIIPILIGPFCSGFRFLHFSTSLRSFVGTYNGTVAIPDFVNEECDTLVAGFISP